MKKVLIMLFLAAWVVSSANATDVTHADKSTGQTLSAAEQNQIKTAVNSKQNSAITDTDDDFTTNTVEAALAQAADEINALESANSLAVTGIITGKIETATDADAHTFTEAEYHGGTVLATGAGIYTLPTAAAGYSGCVEAGQGVTAIIQLLPATGDYIVYEGARGTAATAIASDGSAGDRICYRSYNADDWYVTVTGTWAE